MVGVRLQTPVINVCKRGHGSAYLVGLEPLRLRLKLDELKFGETYIPKTGNAPLEVTKGL